MKTPSHTPRFAGRVRKGVTLFSLATLLSTVTTLAAETTLSEMLELGIYSEETKGDLAAAMKLYEQIVVESAADQSLAAQAQFRLAMCHHKQGNYAAATAAFEQLVKDFPAQEDLVALAHEYLAAGMALLPVPWVDGDEMQYDVFLAGGARVGVGRFGVRAGERDGRKIWLFQNQLMGGAVQWSRVEVDADTFKPLRCLWKVTGLGQADTVYSEGAADVRWTGSDAIKHVEIDGPIHDNEQAVHLMRRLPLADGYETNLRLFVGLGGGNILPVPLRASGTEKVTVPLGEFDCYKVTLRVGPNDQTFWYSADAHRYLVKLEAGGARIELARIVRTSLDEPVLFQDPALGFAVTAPGGWMLTRRERPDETHRTSLVVFDPNGTAITQVRVERAERLDAAAMTSPRAFAEHKIAQGSRRMKSFALRADSWREFTVAGQPAVSFVADIEQGAQPEVMCGVHAVVDGRAVEFWCVTAPGEFEGFRPQFDALVASFTIE